MALCPWTDLLDPRPAGEFDLAPTVGSVSLPFDELTQRIHELPERGSKIRICDWGDSTDRVMDQLQDKGYSCERSEPVLGIAQRFRLWKPCQFLIENLPSWISGDALDLGCGSGRDVVALAASGWNVTAIDHLPDAIEKGKDLLNRYAREAKESVCWLVGDVRETLLGQDERSYDLIYSIRFLDELALTTAVQFLKPGGFLIIETFSEKHRQRTGKPHLNRVLSAEALARLSPSLDLVTWTDSDPFAHVVMCKR